MLPQIYICTDVFDQYSKHLSPARPDYWPRRKSIVERRVDHLRAKTRHGECLHHCESARRGTSVLSLYSVAVNISYHIAFICILY